MNENPLDNLPPPPDQLPCETIVYRAALESTWFSEDGQEVDLVAFHRRRGGYDEDGVSIGATPYAHRASGLTGPIAGIISVHVGRVRDVADPEMRDPLDVEIDNHPHGNIKNVPIEREEGTAKAICRQSCQSSSENCLKTS